VIAASRTVSTGSKVLLRRPRRAGSRGGHAVPPQAEHPHRRRLIEDPDRQRRSLRRRRAITPATTSRAGRTSAHISQPFTVLPPWIDDNRRPQEC
jgi:hypothetical protein